jgi:hypothetical protein
VNPAARCAAFAVALNSAVHSHLILHYADGDRVQWKGLDACLWASVAFVLGGAALSLLLPGDARLAPARLTEA